LQYVLQIVNPNSIGMCVNVCKHILSKSIKEQNVKYTKKWSIIWSANSGFRRFWNVLVARANSQFFVQFYQVFSLSLNASFFTSKWGGFSPVHISYFPPYLDNDLVIASKAFLQTANVIAECLISMQCLIISVFMCLHLEFVQTSVSGSQNVVHLPLVRPRYFLLVREWIPGHMHVYCQINLWSLLLLQLPQTTCLSAILSHYSWTSVF